LLVVTFTHAAAAEMRERAISTIFKEMQQKKYYTKLRRQLLLLNKAKISTLHSFCTELIRQYFYLIEMDPFLRVIPAEEASLLEEEALDELLDAKYEEGKNDFLRLVDYYGGLRDDSSLGELVRKIYTFLRSLPEPDLWLKNTRESFSEKKSTDLSPFLEEIKNYLALEFELAQKNIEDALFLSSLPNGPAAYQNVLKNEIDSIQDVKASLNNDWDDIAQKLQEINFERLPNVRNDEGNLSIKKGAQDFRNAAKKILSDIQKDLFFQSKEDFLQDLKYVAPFMVTLVDLTEDFSRFYAQKKKEKNLLDFSDLEHFGLQILAYLASENEHPISFEEVMVDEYQDISEVQDKIIYISASLNTGKSRIFMVGDPKQSIYRFRQAEPSLFQEKYKKFSPQKDALCRRIELTKNFRSRKEIIDGVNFIFRQIMSPKVGELEYGPHEKLVLGAQYPEEERPIEFYLFDNKDEDKTDEELEDLTAVQKEARLVAKRIKEMMNEGFQVFDSRTQKMRPLAYRDIGVLMRTAKGRVNTFMEEFYLNEIPAYSEDTSGYLEATEVTTMLALLNLIDNPYQDIPLAAVLRSPLVGLTAKEMALIRLNKRGDYFWEAVNKSTEAEDDLAAKVKPFLENLERWRVFASRNSLADLIWTIYRETGFLDYVGGLPGGTQRQANLRALYDRARAYESLNFRGLFRFLRFIEELKEKGEDLGEAKSLGENMDVVRVMSVHKSKGLEFPVVFIVGLGTKFKLNDNNEDVLFHKELGFGPVVVDLEHHIKWKTLRQEAIKKRIKRESIAEEMRILYVALTRAKEKLILVGTASNLSKSVTDSWLNVIHSNKEKINPAYLSSANRSLDWLLSALIRHPQADELRQGIDFLNTQETGCILDDPSSWQINVVKSTDLQQEKEKKVLSFPLKEMKEFIPITTSGKFQNRVEEILSWDYPYKLATDKKAKITATEANHWLNFLEENYPESYSHNFRHPRFWEEKEGLTKAQIGTAFHLALSHLDLKKVKKTEIEEQITEMVYKEILTPEEAEAISIETILSFFDSDLGKRLCKAQKIWREVPFSLRLAAKEVYPELINSEEPVLMQGVIDCLFLEEDQIVIIDYKSDELQDEEEMALKAKSYIPQLKSYARAVEEILQKKVAAAYLYFLRPAKEFLCF